MSQVGENFPFENKPPSAMGATLLGDRYAATPQPTSFSFQTSSSSSFSMSSGSDGKAHQQVMQMRTQRGSDGRTTKSVSHSRACIDGNCDMKTIQGTAAAPGVEFVEGITMRGPQGGKLDREMSYMLGMDNPKIMRVDQHRKKSSMRKPLGTGDSKSAGTEILLEGKKKKAFHSSSPGSSKRDEGTDDLDEEALASADSVPSETADEV